MLYPDGQAELAKYQADLRDRASYQYATICAQWGDIAKALEWLATAMHLRELRYPRQSLSEALAKCAPG